MSLYFQNQIVKAESSHVSISVFLTLLEDEKKRLSKGIQSL